MQTPAITISKVTKRFGRTTAVDALDLVVPEGSLCGFLGPNGAGKSTTIRMIMSIIYPDEGQITVLGGTALEAKDRIGYLPEERGVYRKMRVGEFLAYMARLKGVPSRGVRSLVGKWLERVALPGVERKRCSELSKGMQQKVQFVAALIHEPQLLILDEPFSGLDPMNAEVMRSLVEELHAEGRSIIFSTHALHQAEKLCDRIFLINHGVKLLDSSLDEIRRTYDPRTLLVEPLVDAPGGAFAESSTDRAGESLGRSSDGSRPNLDARIAATLSSLPGVAEARMIDDGAYELLLDDGGESQAVMRAVADALPIRRVELRRVSLEEIFVRLVRRSEGRDAASQARVALATP
jgi:ABC-2 type transport system ATP-binding protein